MFDILVVEDDKELLELYTTVLIENGYRTHMASNGEEAIGILYSKHVDLMISDIMMPVMDGYQLTKEIRSMDFTMPVLMITAKDEMNDKRQGFLSGTDDYMVKPIDVNEMMWRVEALLRRSQIMNERKIQRGNVNFNYDEMTVKYNDEVITLPQKEFYLIYKLAASPNRIFTRRQILDEIWGIDKDVDPHTLEVHISRLRERFKDNDDFKIVTVRGLGYKVVRNE
ncbi:MAG: response regulator transcription factor [Suipraeoptans sp.]